MRHHYFWDRAARDGRGDWVVAQPRRGRPGIMVISDALDGVLNPIDGRRYDSKAAYQTAVRAAGCEIVGNDAAFGAPPPRAPHPPDVGRDVKRAMEELSE